MTSDETRQELLEAIDYYKNHYGFEDSGEIRELLTAHEQALTGWQLIETAPKDGDYILAIGPGSRFPTVIAWNIWVGEWADGPAPPDMHPLRVVTIKPTHWIPLPSPPVVTP